MTAHTPGPWYRNIRASGKYPTIFAGRNTRVAVASQQKDSSVTEANIDLIAAAPELLAALKKIASGSVDHFNFEEYRSLVEEFRELASAAIAKANLRQSFQDY
jgi:hypothetical protein